MNLIIKKEKVHFDRDTPIRPAQSAHQHERRAKLISIAGVARAIEVSCMCGENFVIELEFEEGPA